MTRGFRLRGLTGDRKLAAIFGLLRMSDQRQWTRRETELLNVAAVEKLLQVAEEVGVSPEDMIAFLDSGCSVRDLLIFLASKRSGVA